MLSRTTPGNRGRTELRAARIRRPALATGGTACMQYSGRVLTIA